MFERFNGNVVPFADESTSTNRTVFGSETQSDDIDDNLNADFKKGWEIVGLNDNPTREDFNAMGYTLGYLTSYLYQSGVAEYNLLQEYKTNSIAIGTDGNIYQSLVDNNIGNALTDTTKWVCIASKNSIVNSIAELKTISNIESINVLGYYEKGDGGGGTFYWDPTSIEADNGGTIIQATGVTIGRWKRVFSGAVNVEWFGAKGDGVTDDTAAIQNCINFSTTVIFSKDKTYLYSSLMLVDRIKIYGEGATIKTNTSVNDSIIASDYFDISNLTIDDNFAINSTLKSSAFGFNMSDVVFLNSLNYPLYADNVTEKVNLNNIACINTGKGVHIYGGGATASNSRVGTVAFINGITNGTTGSTGNIYFFSQLARVLVEGGHFKGSATSAPNIHRTDNFEIIGGYYKNLLRGATVGEDTRNGVITGVTSIGCSFSGISVDILETGGVYPEGNIIVNSCNTVSCGYAVYAQGKKISISDINIDKCYNDSGLIRINGSDDCVVDNIKVSDCTSPCSVVSLGNASKVTIGRLTFDDSINEDLPVSAGNSAGSTIAYMNSQKTYTSSFDLPSYVDVVFLDLSLGAIDVDLRSSSYGKIGGRVVKFIIVAQPGGHNVTFTSQNGVDLVNNTSIFTLIAPPIGKQVTAISNNEGDWFVG